MHVVVMGVLALGTICMDMDTKTLHKGRDEIIKTF
jgi:hypothetical protein